MLLVISSTTRKYLKKKSERNDIKVVYEKITFNTKACNGRIEKDITEISKLTYKSCYH